MRVLIGSESSRAISEDIDIAEQVSHFDFQHFETFVFKIRDKA